MNKFKDAVEAWQVADSGARNVEIELRETWLRFHRKEGPPPSEDLIAEVSRLRAVANEKLTLAMVQMGVSIGG